MCQQIVAVQVVLIKSIVSNKKASSRRIWLLFYTVIFLVLLFWVCFLPWNIHRNDANI